jgi:hypothetical protein
VIFLFENSILHAWPKCTFASGWSNMPDLNLVLDAHSCNKDRSTAKSRVLRGTKFSTQLYQYRYKYMYPSAAHCLCTSRYRSMI